jgi:plastocyanin
MKMMGWQLAIVVAIAAAGPALAGGTAAVDVNDFKFATPVLTVPAGTTVVWTNHDEEPHTVTSASGAFGSTGLSHDESFSRTFASPGRYEYFCALHPHMKGTVIVR